MPTQFFWLNIRNIKILKHRPPGNHTSCAICGTGTCNKRVRSKFPPFLSAICVCNIAAHDMQIHRKVPCFLSTIFARNISSYATQVCSQFPHFYCTVKHKSAAPKVCCILSRGTGVCSEFPRVHCDARRKFAVSAICNISFRVLWLWQVPLCLSLILGEVLLPHPQR